MNERIKLLAEQAIVERLTIDDFVAALKKEPHDFYGFRVAELEKFAELIVAECARLADNSPQYIDGREILEHFGVEE